MEDVCVYSDAKERADIFEFLDSLEVEYHKEYKRFNQIVKVPRGQASYTLSGDIHYDYKVSGGSPPNCGNINDLAYTPGINSLYGNH